MVATAGLVHAPTAQAAITASPARTWGVGPDVTTSASGGKPRVLAILPVGDRVFVAGTFDSVIDPAGLTYPAENFAVFSASTGAADLSFQASVNGTVNALATDGAKVYLGGVFDSVNGATRRGLAAIDVSTGALTSWSPDVNGGQVDALAYAGGQVYAGGNFGSVAGSTGVSRPFAAKISTSSEAVDGSWAAAPNERVRALNVAANGSGRLYLGGEFSQVSGRGGTNRLAAVQLSTGAVDTAFTAPATNAGAYSPVYDIASDGLRVYVGSAGGGGACAAMSATTGALQWSAHSNGNMQSVRVLNGLLYCAGHYGGTGSFMGQDRQKLAAVDIATGALTSFAPTINSSQGPWSLGVSANRLYMGGDFNKVSGVRQPHFAMFVDSSLRTRPLPPASLVAEAGNAQVDLSWTPPSSDGGSPVKKYRVFRSTTPGGQNLSGTPLATLSSSTRTYRDTAVANGTTYHYVVLAESALGKSSPSPEASATPSGTATVVAPSAPRNLIAESPDGAITLSWNPPLTTGGAPVTSYRVYRATAPGAQNRATPLKSGITATTFSDTTGVPGTTYFYIVTAVNQAGEGPASNEVWAAATQTPPGAPTLSAVVSGRSVQLTWTIPPNNGSPITKYIILRDSVRLVTLSADASGGPTTYTDLAVPVGTHTYRIKAQNDGGNGPLSNEVSVRVR